MHRNGMASSAHYSRKTTTSSETLLLPRDDLCRLKGAEARPNRTCCGWSAIRQRVWVRPVASLIFGPYANNREMQYVHHFELPERFAVHECLGKGANNKAFRANWDGVELLLRVPRRGSDTQSRECAKWEYQHTMRASEIGAGPEVRAAWCARHRNGGWPSGMYIVTEMYDDDLENVLADAALRHDYGDVGQQVVTCLQRLAEDHMFCFDLKPSNIVVRKNAETGTVECRIIDYGREFTEWSNDKDTDCNDNHTPCITSLKRKGKLSPGELSHILFAAMLVQLAATTTFQLYHDRRKHGMPQKERRKVNPFIVYAETLLISMQGVNKSRMRALLRKDTVRSVLKHYVGRRNAGTDRVCKMAQGDEY